MADKSIEVTKIAYNLRSNTDLLSSLSVKLYRFCQNPPESTEQYTKFAESFIGNDIIANDVPIIDLPFYINAMQPTAVPVAIKNALGNNPAEINRFAMSKIQIILAYCNLCSVLLSFARPIETIYTLEQVSEILRVSPRVAKNLVDDKELPAFNIGIHVRVPKSSINSYIHTHSSTRKSKKRRFVAPRAEQPKPHSEQSKQRTEQPKQVHDTTVTKPHNSQQPKSLPNPPKNQSKNSLKTASNKPFFEQKPRKTHERPNLTVLVEEKPKKKPQMEAIVMQGRAEKPKEDTIIQNNESPAEKPSDAVSETLPPLNIDSVPEAASGQEKKPKKAEKTEGTDDIEVPSFSEAPKKAEVPVEDKAKETKEEENVLSDDDLAEELDEAISTISDFNENSDNDKDTENANQDVIAPSDALATPAEELVQDVPATVEEDSPKAIEFGNISVVNDTDGVDLLGGTKAETKKKPSVPIRRKTVE